MNLPNLLFKKPHFFGVSIGKTALRGIEIDRKHKVSAYAQVAIPENVLDGGVIDIGAFEDALKKLVQKGRFSTRYVSVCFPESYAFSKEHVLPEIQDSEISEAISWQIKDIFPFAANEIYFDWKILKKSVKETIVLVVAAQKKILDDITSTFSKVGIRPLSFAPSASVLGPLMPLKEDEIALLIEVNNRGSMATIVEHHVSFLTTTASFPHGSPELAVKKTINSVKELLSYYNGKKNLTKEKVRILLSGESASEKLLGEFSSSFAYPASLLTLKNIPPAFHKSYAAAALCVFRPEDRAGINLLPKTYQESYDLEEVYARYVLHAKIGIGLLVISLLFLLTSFITVLSQKGSFQNEVARLQRDLELAGFNRKEVNQANNLAQKVVSLFPLKKTTESDISVIFQLIPEGITINQWTFSSITNTIGLSGIALKREQILIFRNRLEESFKKVSIPLSSLELPENVQFSVEIQLANESESK